PPPPPPAGPRAGGHLRRMVIGPSLATAVIAAAVFIVTPRLEAPLAVLPWQPQPKSVIGLHHNVTLGGAAGVLTESREVVLTMTVRSDQDYSASGRAFRLRARVLDRYDAEHHTWRSSQESASVARPRRWSPEDPEPVPPEASPLYRFDISLREGVMGRLLAPWRPVHFQFDADQHPEGFRYSFNEHDGTATWSLTRFPSFSYTVYAIPTALAAPPEDGFGSDPGFDPSRRGPGQRLRRWWEADPPRVCAKPSHFGDTPIADLARSILAERGIDLNSPDRDTVDSAATAFKLHLSRHYEYSPMESIGSPEGGPDPIEVFLFDEDRGKRGHCEYFASAMTALCQSVGIPARVVTGYIATEYDPVTGVYTVRESDAHAWAEVEVRPNRWRDFDPTPREAVLTAEPDTGPLLASVRRALDFLQLAWVQSIVAFDRDRQSVALRSVGATPANVLRSLNQWVGDRLLDRPMRAAETNPGLAAASTFLWVLVIASAAGLGFYLLRERLRALLASFRSGGGGGGSARRGPEDPVTTAYRGLYRRLLHAGARVRCRPGPGDSPLVFASALAERDPALGGLLHDMQMVA
ncbi:MAG TPA: hypothetical protein DEB06_04765, partial [Phycisphaerales bacterium]|nr:hypothetical protein [Phycisphaerales bacterium]